MGELVEGQREQAKGLGAIARGALLVGVAALASPACMSLVDGPPAAPRDAAQAGAVPGASPARGRDVRGRLLETQAAYAVRFREGGDSYLSGDFSSASESFREAFLCARPGSADAAQALYWFGRSEFALGRLAEARAALERAAASASGALRAIALAALSDVAIEQARFAEAIELLDRIEREGLAGELPADEMLFRKGGALAGLRRREEAAAVFERASRLASSPLAADAALRAEALRRAHYEARAGIFREKTPAERAAGLLRERGLPARVEPVAGQGRGAFVVSLGRYAERSEAERVAEAASREGFPGHVWP